MSEVDSKDFVWSTVVKSMKWSFSELQNEQKDQDTIPNLNNMLLKNKMLFNSLHWNTRILLSLVTTRGRIIIFQSMFDWERCFSK